MKSAVVLLACSCLAAGPAAGEITLLQPGPAGEDSSPYSFLPSLPRGNRDTQYAFTGVDESGLPHAFETFVRFELPAAWPAAGEEVVGATLWVYYGFDFAGFGDASEVPGALYCREILEPWEEATLTWIHKPGYGPVVDVQPGITGLGLIWCDVTRLVAAWVGGERPNYGIALTNPTARLIGFYSFEASVDANLRPSLAIETAPRGGGGGSGSAAPPGGGDLTGDGRVDEADLVAFAAAAALGALDPGFRADLDRDGDGEIDLGDYAAWRADFAAQYTGPVAGVSCGARSAGELERLLEWWVARGAAPTREFQACYGL